MKSTFMNYIYITLFQKFNLWNEFNQSDSLFNVKFSKYIFYTYIVISLLNCSLKAETVKAIPIDNFYETTTLIPVYFKKSDFKIISMDVAKNLNLQLSPTFTNKKIVSVLLTQEQLKLLDTLSIKYEINKNAPFRHYLKDYHDIYKKGYGGLSSLIQEYKSFDLNERYLKGLAIQFPELVTYEELGKTRFGHTIPAIRITKNSEKQKVSILFNGAHHANELIATEHCYDIIHTILSNPKEYEEYLENINIWIVPIVNPDGSHLFWYKDIRMGRKNGYLHESHTKNEPNRGTDLNRNYPFKWDSGNPRASSNNPSHSFYRGTEPASEPETKAMIGLANREKFLFSMSFHSFATKLLFPYTIEDVKNPNPDYPQILATKLVKFAISYHPVKKYEAVKNIYPVDGTDQDYYYNEFGTIAFLAESSHKNIEYSKVKYVLEGFRPVWQNLLKESMEGYKISVKVVDSEENPIRAEVVPEDYVFHENEKNLSDETTGVYRRMVLNNKEIKLKIKHPQFSEETITLKPSREILPTVIQLRAETNNN